MRPMCDRKFSWIVAWLLGSLGGVASAETPAAPAAPPAAVSPGHSWHGESFNEGPRQAARLMGGTGDVSFPATSTHPEVQAFINQGVGQLHGFWFYEAERSFRHAASLDPECAVAYWGMAMANVNNGKRAKAFIAEADKRKAKASPREILYIDGLKAFYDKEDSKESDANESRRKALVKSYEQIIDQFPDDLEAKAFLIGQIWDNHGHGLPITAYFPVDALLKEVFAVNPRHPVHHYRIHLWDYEKPERALSAAADCGPSAPNIAHMWHMPGHIYARLNRYHDAAYQQEASARVDHAFMMRDRILPDQIHNYAHNNEWLIRDLVNVGRMTDAIRMSKALIENPQHPKFNTLSNDGSFNFGRKRLSAVLTEFERWDDILRLTESPYLEPTANEEEQVRRLRLIGRARFRRGDFTEGCGLLKDLQARQSGIFDERQAAIAKARDEATKANKPAKEIDEAGDNARKTFNGRLNPLEAAIAELSGYVHLADRAYVDALNAFDKAGKFDPALMARTRLQAGRVDEAIAGARKEAESQKQEVLPLAQLVETLWAANRRDEARVEFEKLRDVGAELDPQAPIYGRLSALAAELQWPADWRKPRVIPTDLGDRPALDSLGPFAWSPGSAPAWTLPDAANHQRALADFAGQPTVLVFSLGSGCLHCNEQLKAFATAHPRFTAEGLKLIAISTDSVENLGLSVKEWQADSELSKGVLPPLLLSNPTLEAFKAYRCFDDFEQKPLHGTFLIDAAGQISWWDIGPEPFSDVDFLIAESKRLLSLRSLGGASVAPPSTGLTAGTASTAGGSGPATETCVPPPADAATPGS